MQHRLDGIDLTGYVSKVDLSHGRDDETPWKEQLAGLKESSFTVSGSFDTGAFTLPAQQTQLTVDVPDGRWQRLKSRLAQRWPFRWLKVRCLRFTTIGSLQYDADTGVATINGASHITVNVVTRRGKL